MKTTKSSKIQRYLFEDKVSAVRATIIGNLLMGMIILFAGWDDFTKVPQTQFSLFTGLILLIIFMNYTWKNPEVNWLISILYLGGVVVEWLTVGIPKSPMPFRADTMDKGVLFEMLVNLLPYFYVSLRVLFVIPLIGVSIVSKNVDAED